MDGVAKILLVDAFVLAGLWLFRVEIFRAVFNDAARRKKEKLKTPLERILDDERVPSDEEERLRQLVLRNPGVIAAPAPAPTPPPVAPAAADPLLAQVAAALSSPKR